MSHMNTQSEMYQDKNFQDQDYCMWDFQNEDDTIPNNFKFLESLVVIPLLEDINNDGSMITDYFDTIRHDVHEVEESKLNLDSIRRGALEVDEFRKNGFECDLDDLDTYQVQLRRQTVHDKINVHKDNPIVLEVMAFKERKKALRRAKSKKICVFCKNNGESTSVYTSHVLKDSDGKVSCPVLRKYTCPVCGIYGDEAHTIKYCPRNEVGEHSVFYNNS